MALAAWGCGAHFRFAACPVRTDDLFTPLDVHFARNHTIKNLLQMYPSVCSQHMQASAVDECPRADFLWTMGDEGRRFLRIVHVLTAYVPVL
jgi:hypothetical protein